MDESPLHSASYYADERKVEVLLAHGADVNAEDHVGTTPVHWAAQNGHGDVVKLLLEQGAEKAATPRRGTTALHFAASKGQQCMVEMLMGRGMDPNQKDLYGNTALHLAASHHDMQTVVTLLDGGCDPNIMNETGETPLSLCVQRRPCKSDYVAVLTTACSLILHGAVHNDSSGQYQNRSRKNRSEAAIVATCVHYWASEPHSRLDHILAELIDNGMAAAQAYLTEKRATREQNPVLWILSRVF